LNKYFNPWVYFVKHPRNEFRRITIGYYHCRDLLQSVVPQMQRRWRTYLLRSLNTSFILIIKQGEYDEISREVRGLHTVLRHLKYEVEAPESPLNRDCSTWGHQLAPIIGDCDFTLRSLDNLITKYGRLSSADSSPTSPRVLWDKVRFGSNEMDQLGAVRVKLISHKTSLTLFLDTIQLHQSGKMATTLDNHGGQLDVILDKVDGIAARMAQKNGSIMTNYDDDDKEVWKQFRRELVAEGFSSDVLQQHMVSLCLLITIPS
jgi:hypothetical protein